MIAFTLVLVSIITLFAFAMYQNKKDPKTNNVSNEQAEQGHKDTHTIRKSAGKQEENLVAKIFFVLGFLFFAVGFFGGIIVANDFHHFSTFLFLIWTISGFITGMIFIGFGEIIRLLQAQFDKSLERNEYLEKISDNDKNK